MTDNILQIRNLTQSFDTTVLDNINLDIKSGEFLTLLGPSGCGKTTLLNLLAGFITPDSGEITMHGKDISTVPANKRPLNTVFQSYALFPHLTIFENVAFSLRCQKLHEAVIERRSRKALQRVKLEHLADRMPSQISGGQQQRVAIARAIVNEPDILLLDEPLSALDYSLRKEMQMELKSLQQELGITFILVTHDQEEALSMANRIAVMRDGRIAQLGTPREIYEEPNSLYVANFIGHANVFDTQVIAANDTNLVVELEGEKFPLQNTKGFKTGDKVHCLLRPEDFQVWDKSEIDTGDLMLAATIQQAIYKGSTVDLSLVLKHSGTRILTTAFFDEDDDTLNYKISEDVWAQWIPGWEVLLPYEK